MAHAFFSVAKSFSGTEIRAIEDIEDLFWRPLIGRKFSPLFALTPEAGLALALNQRQGVSGPAGIVHKGDV